MPKIATCTVSHLGTEDFSCRRREEQRRKQEERGTINHFLSRNNLLENPLFPVSAQKGEKKAGENNDPESEKNGRQKIAMIASFLMHHTSQAKVVLFCFFFKMAIFSWKPEGEDKSSLNIHPTMFIKCWVINVLSKQFARELFPHPPRSRRSRSLPDNECITNGKNKHTPMRE